MKELNFDKLNGLLPVVVQDYRNNEVLMVAFMNKEAWKKTLETRKAHYYSRSRSKLWMKGESSGHIQEVKDILVDCDDDTILLKVDQNGGAACHTGHKSCFFRKFENGHFNGIGERKVFNPEEVYGNKSINLIDGKTFTQEVGDNKMLKPQEVSIKKWTN